LNKDTARIAVERILKDLQAKVRSSGKVEMCIPGLGVLNIYDGIAAVSFEESLTAQSNQITNQHWNSVTRKKESQNFLTNEVMEKFKLREVQRYLSKGRL
jgi:hypothetical protein